MSDDDRLLMQAALDGELDAQAQRAFERRLSIEPELAAAFANLQTLRAAIRALPTERAPDHLRTKIAAMAGPARLASAAPSRAPMQRRASWGAIAATFAALFVGGAGGWLVATQTQPSPVTAALVTAHVRGLMAEHPVDVASSDQHTVRPWFAGKLTTAPAVLDLADAGFPLEGARLDVVNEQPEPTLVYRRGRHTISVTRLPDTSVPGTGPAHRTIAGHATLTWRSGDHRYFAVSDAAPAELDALRAAFEKAHTTR